MTPSFRQAAIVGSSLCLALAAVWMGAPQFILWVWQTNGSDSTLLMARRGAALFLGLGLAVMLWLTRNAESSPPATRSQPDFRFLALRWRRSECMISSPGTPASAYWRPSPSRRCWH
jgi:hypothetical protein